MKLSNFLYNLHDFNLLVDEQPSMTETVKLAWGNLYNQYDQLAIVFTDINLPESNRDSDELNTLMRTILEFVLDNFRYFNYCFDYTIDERLAICPRLTVENQTIIYSDLIAKYIIYPEPIDWLDDAYTKLDAIYERRKVQSAEWSLETWVVNDVSAEKGWYIVDNENGSLSFCKRTVNEETGEYEFEDIVEYNVEDVNDLITHVSDYTDYDDGVYDEQENAFKKAVLILKEHFTEMVSGGADWAVRTWSVKTIGNKNYYICDNEIGEFEFVSKDTYLEEQGEQEIFETIKTVDYSEINELITFANDYQILDTQGIPEIVNIVFDKDATIAKADGDTILVATMSNDDELTFYVGNSGEIEFIEENGVDAFDSLMGKYDTEILEFFNANQDEIMNNFDVMQVEENSEDLSNKVCDLLNTDLENFGVSTYGISDYFLETYNLSRTQPNSTMFRITCYVGESITKDIVSSLSTIGIKPISIKRGTTSRRAEFHEYFIEIDFTNPTAAGLVKTPAQKIKYTAIDKKTYSTDSGGLEFEVEINGMKARGLWRPTSDYNPGGVDVDTLYYDNNKFKTIEIFAGGGGNRHYEMHGYPKKLDKQPKNLRFTGEYYSTLELGDTFKKKILEALAGNNKNTQLTDEFLKFFKLK